MRSIFLDIQDVLAFNSFGRWGLCSYEASCFLLIGLCSYEASYFLLIIYGEQSIRFSSSCSINQGDHILTGCFLPDNSSLPPFAREMAIWATAQPACCPWLFLLESLECLKRIVAASWVFPNLTKVGSNALVLPSSSYG